MINPLKKYNSRGFADKSVKVIRLDKNPEAVITIGDNYYLRSGTVIYEKTKIGKNFITGHNAVIREENRIGDNVIVGVGSYLGPGNIIGNNVRIHTNCFVENCRLADGVIIAPGVTFTNDPYPPCKICVGEIGGAVVGKSSVIGANVTVLPGITIGKNCLIGAGSVVTHNIPDEVIAVGNPARIIKKISQLKHIHQKLK